MPTIKETVKKTYKWDIYGIHLRFLPKSTASQTLAQQYNNIDLTAVIPANTSRWPNVVLMLAHRVIRWPNINPTLGQRLVFAGITAVKYYTSSYNRYSGE